VVLSYSREGGVAWAVLNRPEKLNAMPATFWAELREVIERAEADPEVRALIFRGEGRAFSVGGDIEGFGELGDSGERRAYMREALGTYQMVEGFSKPTICAVHGLAAGGGCELTMVCDIIIADETAQFATPECRVGLVPGLGLVRGGANLNQHWLRYMIFTGEPLDAEQARLAGLVNFVVPAGEHVAEARRIAELIAERAPLAISVGKEVVSRDADHGYGHAIEAISFLFGSADQAEGIAAFRERRPPKFEGR
jgi:enoyl-CoA hydratase/carnithine racemase